MTATEAPSPRFRNGPRVPPGYWVLVGAGPLVLLGVALATGGSDNPNAWWQALLFLLLLDLVAGVAVIPHAWAEVVVDDRGLRVRRRLRVAAGEMGRVELLDGTDAARASWFRRWSGRRIAMRQNLYGGAYGWGPGVVVEHQPRSGEPSLWLLPGPRARELAEALSNVRTDPRSQPAGDQRRDRP